MQNYIHMFMVIIYFNDTKIDHTQSLGFFLEEFSKISQLKGRQLWFEKIFKMMYFMITAFIKRTIAINTSYKCIIEMNSNGNDYFEFFMIIYGKLVVFYHN
ncbi:unnamed protein product [Schistosoma margrebowiei]|uniref:Uncharacterized protein n=1 Tax=Schistosoma margrebowiei TaxID=48269 RepID=A0AA85ACV6_9TREM|nr:unnamed protein product [Schistosoma margrebowiei]